MTKLGNHERGPARGLGGKPGSRTLLPRVRHGEAARQLLGKRPATPTLHPHPKSSHGHPHTCAAAARPEMAEATERPWTGDWINWTKERWSGGPGVQGGPGPALTRKDFLPPATPGVDLEDIKPHEPRQRQGRPTETPRSRGAEVGRTRRDREAVGAPGWGRLCELAVGGGGVSIREEEKESSGARGGGWLHVNALMPQNCPPKWLKR